jgi:hypothetical protein
VWAAAAAPGPTSVVGVSAAMVAASTSRRTQVRLRLAQHLERDVLVALPVECPEDLAHGAAPDPFLQDEAVEAGRGSLGRRGHAVAHHIAGAVRQVGFPERWAGRCPREPDRGARAANAVVPSTRQQAVRSGATPGPAGAPDRAPGW